MALEEAQALPRQTAQPHGGAAVGKAWAQESAEVRRNGSWRGGKSPTRPRRTAVSFTVRRAQSLRKVDPRLLPAGWDSPAPGMGAGQQGWVRTTSVAGKGRRRARGPGKVLAQSLQPHRVLGRGAGAHQCGRRSPSGEAPPSAWMLTEGDHRSHACPSPEVPFSRANEVRALNYQIQKSEQSGLPLVV